MSILIETLLAEAAAEIARLTADCDVFQRGYVAEVKLRGAAEAERDEANAKLSKAQKALEEIASWKHDTLGPRPHKPSEQSEKSEAFDRGVRMAFYRCANRALADLTQPG